MKYSFIMLYRRPWLVKYCIAGKSGEEKVGEFTRFEHLGKEFGE